MEFFPPTTPPPPPTAEDQALIDEASKIFATLKDRPRVSQSLQERASDGSSDANEESEDAPLI